MGIPAVPMATRAFADLAKSNASKRGMPHIRAAFTPHPVWGKTPEQLMAYVEGNDPVSGKPLKKEIVEFVRPKMAGFKVPRSIDFVPELPRSAAGKIKRGEVRKPFWEGRKVQI